MEGGFASPTLEDVAKHAGVSTRTASRVLNDEQHVSEKVRARVRRSMTMLHYTPNIVARGMVTKKTGILALSLSVVTSPLLVPLIKGAMDQARRRGYQLVLCETGQKRAEELEYLILSRSGLVDGVILASQVVAPGIPYGIEEIQAISLVNYHIPGFNHPQFIQDCETDAYMLTRHLIEQGAFTIAFFSGPQENMSSQLKLNGIKKALAEYDIPYYPELTLYGKYTVESGRTAMRALDMRNLPDAIFAGSDMIGFGVMQVAKEKGLAMPADISICGFDDHPSSAYTDPALTSVRPDMYGMGVMAVDACLDQIRGGRKDATDEPVIPSARRVLIPGQVVVRSSTKPALANSLPAKSHEVISNDVCPA